MIPTEQEDLMLKKQRHQMILEYLQKHQFAKVEDLNLQTESSEITTRRDINELHELGLLEKVYGGAQRIHTEKEDVIVAQRLSSHIPEKTRIAETAAGLIPKGSVIYLDAGSSVHAMIPFLSGLSVKVITHGIHHIEQLANYHIATYLIGGDVKASTLASTGSNALEAISKMTYDIAFMGTNAVDPVFGLSTPDIEEAAIKSKIIEHSEITYILADASKFMKRSHVQFAEAHHNIISDYVDVDEGSVFNIIPIN